MNVALEMRITGGSDITLAPQKGNKATCSIEVLSLACLEKDGSSREKHQKKWHSFMQDVFDIWCKYTDFNGQPLKIRPHWAKDWEGLTYTNPVTKKKVEIIDYLTKVAFNEERVKFKSDLQEIARKGGYTLKDMIDRFSNPLLKKLFLDD